MQITLACIVDEAQCERGGGGGGSGRVFQGGVLRSEVAHAQCGWVSLASVRALVDYQIPDMIFLLTNVCDLYNCSFEKSRHPRPPPTKKNAPQKIVSGKRRG